MTIEAINNKTENNFANYLAEKAVSIGDMDGKLSLEESIEKNLISIDYLKKRYYFSVDSIDIFYAADKKVHIKIGDELREINQFYTLKKLAEAYGLNYDFIKVKSNTLVRMVKIRKISSAGAIVDNQLLPISRHKKKFLKMEFIESIEAEKELLLQKGVGVYERINKKSILFTSKQRWKGKDGDSRFIIITDDFQVHDFQITRPNTFVIKAIKNIENDDDFFEFFRNKYINMNNIDRVIRKSSVDVSIMIGDDNISIAKRKIKGFLKAWEEFNERKKD